VEDDVDNIVEPGKGMRAKCQAWQGSLDVFEVAQTAAGSMIHEAFR
jgi:hypothetical protein